MSRYKKDLGRRGEIEAVIFLHKNGFTILEQNFYTHWGEIDIVVQKDNAISFIEVKARIGENKGKPYEAVNSGKIKRLSRAIQYYVLKKHLKNYKLSLDVISITFNQKLKIEKIYHFKNIGQ